MCQIDHEYITFFDDLSYSRERIYMFWVCQVSGLVENFNIGVFSDNINVVNVKLCMMILHTELYLFVTLSVTLTLIQGHSSVSFNWKFYVPIQLSWNFVGLLSTSSKSWIYHCFWLPHVYKGDNWHVSWFDKNFIIGSMMDTASEGFWNFALL